MFEESIKELEKIVEKLERGDVGLEESLDLFEKGIKLSKACNDMLDKAEKKVSVLINGEKQDFIAEEE
ncbi:MAG: exodeoxyribonuclease VII small subunit [Clostridia bacterium]|nr:exodeoxyribonuclease VII small subunit [Clostridia bacterium]